METSCSSEFVVTHLVKKFPAFYGTMEPEDSLPCLQEPASGPYLKPHAPSPHLLTLFLKIHSNIIFTSTSH